MIDELPGGALRLHLLVQPNASKTEIIGPHDGALKIRVQAPPSDHQANDAVISFLAKKLRIGRKSILFLRGETSRRKLIEIHGITISELKKLLGLL